MHNPPEPFAESPPSSSSDRIWLLWQLADSALPSGGFAHSSGLEAALQQGELRTVPELQACVKANLSQFGHTALPFMTSANRSPGQFLALDQLCDSFTSNHVANRASRAQGQAMLASCAQIFGAPKLRSFRKNCLAEFASCHYPPVFGVIAHLLELEQGETSRLFIFIHLRGLISAAVRLGIVGPLQGQSLQFALAGHAEGVVLRCGNLLVDDIGQTAPLLDLWQGNQDRLYSRLFQS